MKRTLITILLASACGSACAADRVVVVATPQNSLDMSKPGGLVYYSGAADAANSAYLNATFEKAGRTVVPSNGNFGYSRGVQKTFWIPPGLLYHEGYTVGQSPDVNGAGSSGQRVAVCGGVVATSGGVSTGLGSNSVWNKAANVLELVYNGNRGGTEAAETLVGYGWIFGAMEHTGAFYESHADLAMISPRCFIGTRFKSLQSSGVPDGKSFFGPRSYRAFTHGIYFEHPSESGQDNNAGHCDTVTWEWLQFEYCDNCYTVKRNQSLGHNIGAMVTGAGVTNGIFLDDGGGVKVGTWFVNGDDQTLVKIGPAWDANFREIILQDVQFDGATNGFTIIDIDDSVGRGGVPISVHGTLSKTTTYTLADVVKGEQLWDRFFFNFSGTDGSGNDIAAPINDLSTVDAEGNWRTKSYTIQVTPLGSNLTTGDGKAYFRVPAEVNGWRLEYVAASLDVASSNGIPTFQIRRKRSGSDVDMFTTKITIDQDETDTASAATVQVINTSNDDVATGDRLYFDCDVSGTGAQGYQAYLTFRRW